MRIFLLGFMGSGKTYTGSRLALQLEIPFIDLDQHIVEQAGKSIVQIFDEDGEEHFRALERQALHQMLEFEDVVIGCGGGTPCFFDNMQWMKQHGTTIFLTLPSSILEERLLKEKDHRPLIKHLHKEGQLLAYIDLKLTERNPFYHQAEIIFNADNETLAPWIALEQWVKWG
jgi:shikimate kinase